MLHHVCHESTKQLLQNVTSSNRQKILVTVLTVHTIILVYISLSKNNSKLCQIKVCLS